MKANKDEIVKSEKVNELQIENLIIKLQKEFEFIKDDVEGILLYGSCAIEKADFRSDIDICIIKPRKGGILQRVLRKVGAKYDIKIFEDLPLYIQIDIIEHYRIIHGDDPMLSYYFYGFRRKWEDMRHRIMENRFHSVSEMEMTRRKWLETRRQIHVKA